VEFLYNLRRCGYDNYLTSDTSPTRWDIKRTFEANARLTNAVWNMLDGLEEEFARLIEAGDYLNTWRFIENEIFKLK
jgi:xylose isomerase